MKYTLLFIFLLIGNGFLHAQSQHLIGLETSLQFSNISTNTNYSAYQYRTGIGGGLTYTYQLPLWWSFSTGILYNPRGFSQRILFTDETGKVIKEEDWVYGFDYISIPLKLGVRFGAENVYGFVNIGNVTSILVNSYETSSVPVHTHRPESPSIDFALIVEVGASYQINNKLQLSARLGMQQSFWVSSPNYHIKDKLLHNSLGTTLALKYRLY
jgi:hypothetical protein